MHCLRGGRQLQLAAAPAGDLAQPKRNPS